MGSGVAETKEGKACGVIGEQQDPGYLCKILHKVEWDSL